MISYLDAGTGTMIVSAIAGGIGGLVVAVKMGMARLRSKVTGKPMVEADTGVDAPASSHD